MRVFFGAKKMATESIPLSGQTQKFYGLSTDTKPTVGVSAKATFKESDTGNEYEYSGSSWVLTSTGGSANVSGLATNAVILAAASTYNTTDILGYKITAQGTADWSITLKNGSAITVPFASMIVGDVLPEHLSSITSGTGGTAILYIPA